MADVTGPVSTLPGATMATPEGMVCDWHADRPAVRRVQGETDSFGAEYIDLCQECLDETTKHDEESRTGRCDWCGQQAPDLRPRRDFEEGMSGRVYDVCGACVKREHDQLEAERREYDYDDGPWDEDV